MDGKPAGGGSWLRSVIDLKGKKVAVDKLTPDGGLNVRLFLRQEGLDADRGDVDLVELRGPAEKRWKSVLSGEFAGTFVTLFHDTCAEKAGAHVIQVETLYEEWAHSLERKPYPAIEAIANVFRLTMGSPGDREL